MCAFNKFLKVILLFSHIHFDFLKKQKKEIGNNQMHIYYTKQLLALFGEI